jgi:cystathionine gamma-synthase
MTETPKQNPETIAARAAGAHDEATGGVIPAIHLATTYARDAAYVLPGGRNYIRPDNPAGRQPEAVLNALEGGAGCLVFASGMAAATAVFQALSPGDHVVVPRVMYWALRAWLTGDARRWGLEVEVVDMSDPTKLAAAIRPGKTKLVWIETPANPTWDVTDIAAAAEAAHKAGALLAVDNTVPTPVFTRPLALGADMVMHSATKYLNGHSDVLAGALVTARDDEFWRRVAGIRSLQGGMLGAVESWLLLRGMRTLYLRMPRAAASAQRIAEHFARHPRLEAVLYPGLPEHPGHGVARRQMDGGFGAMLSIRVKGGAAGALAAAGRLALWSRATSLGGVESLVEHRASVEGPDSPAPPDMLRMSVGIEDPADLIADLERALGNA